MSCSSGIVRVTSIAFADVFLSSTLSYWENDVKRGKASTGRTKRSTPMSVVHVADVRGSSVGLHPNQFLEADLPCPWLRACRARSMGASIKGLLRRRHTPAGHRELASVGALVRDPHRIIGRSLSALSS